MFKLQSEKKKKDKEDPKKHQVLVISHYESKAQSRENKNSTFQRAIIDVLGSLFVLIFTGSHCAYSLLKCVFFLIFLKLKNRGEIWLFFNELHFSFWSWSENLLIGNCHVTWSYTKMPPFLRIKFIASC